LKSQKDLLQENYLPRFTDPVDRLANYYRRKIDVAKIWFVNASKKKSNKKISKQLNFLSFQDIIMNLAKVLG
jgi:hypothetical protein